MTCSRNLSCMPALALAGALAGAAEAAIVPFTEDFADGPANWRDASGDNLLDWVAAGGRDGGAYVTSSFVVPDPLPPFGSILFRGQDEYGSSDGAFEGDWIADGVTQFSYFIRHDAPAPLDVFVRFATPDNFPAAVGLAFEPVQPGVWTEIVIPIFPGSPNIILEGGRFADTFGNVGHLQIGVIATEDLIGETINVDLDKVSIIPAPGGLLLLAGAGLGRRRRRRRRL